MQGEYALMAVRRAMSAPRRLVLRCARTTLMKGKAGPISTMTAAPTNADVRRAGLKVLVKPALMSASVCLDK